MKLLLKDLLHSNFTEHTNIFTTVSFVVDDSFDELEFDHLSLDVLGNSLRIILKH